MHCPFPGMDPYLEDPALWPEFHRQFVAVLYESLSSGLTAPRYKAVLGRRQYTTTTSGRGAVEHHEEYIEVRQGKDDTLVSLVDVVSPANKTTPEGREAYLGQRRQARDGGANPVEIDLVLQGRPTLDYSREGLTELDYAVTVVRTSHGDRFEIYASTLRKRLPRFRLPLTSDDRDTVVDLQAAFTRCYEQGGFSGRIDYCREPAVPLGEEDRGWLDATLTAHRLRGPLPAHEEVALAAYYLWEGEGCPHGRDLEHWHQALAQLRRERRATAQRDAMSEGA